MARVPAGPNLKIHRNAAWLSVVVAAVAMALYWPVRDFEFQRFYDDDPYVCMNRPVQDGLSMRGLQWSLSTFAVSNWHPVTWWSHMLDVELFGMNPGAHHMVSAAIHAANSGLLVIALALMTGSGWRSGLVGLLFAIHPIHVESVAWIAERKDVLSTLFGMLALIAYCRFARRPSLTWYFTVAACLVLSLAAKPMLVTLPFVLLLLDFWPLNRLRPRMAGVVANCDNIDTGIARLLLEKVPLLVISAASSVVTTLAQSQSAAIVGLDAIPLQARAANACSAYARYLLHHVYPANLAAYYPQPRVWSWLPAAGALVLLLGITAFAWRARFRAPWQLVGWLWFLGTLVPVIGLVQVGGQAMADRYAYFPSIGILMAVVWTLPALARERMRLGFVLVGAVMIVALTLSWMARKQIATWRDNLTLWTHSINVTGHNTLASMNLGATFSSLNRHQEALALYRTCLALAPSNSTVHHNIGVSEQALGHDEKAIASYREAIRLNPRRADSRTYMGMILLTAGRPHQAVAQLQAAYELDSQNPLTCVALGRAFMVTGRRREAIDLLQLTAASFPQIADPWNNLGLALCLDGQVPKAREAFAQARRLCGGVSPPWFAREEQLAMDGMVEELMSEMTRRQLQGAAHLR